MKQRSAMLGALVRRISEEAMETLLNYNYPGNVRELENILEHALIICQDDTIERKHLPLFLQRGISRLGSTQDSVEDLTRISLNDERHRILETLRRYGWHRGNTARELNMNRSTLWRKMKKYDLFPRHIH
jgi:transcriptional regulator with PAS, ATPase and Fis domain